MARPRDDSSESSVQVGSLPSCRKARLGRVSAFMDRGPELVLSYPFMTGLGGNAGSFTVNDEGLAVRQSSAHLGS
jgi:hypothetical protein